jgi:VWFA-related protein
MSVVFVALLAAITSIAQTPLFRAETERVRVDAVVTRNGEPVGGLTAADFELRDAGVLQTLEAIREEQTPIDVVLVFDLSHSVDGAKLSALRDAAGAFLDGLRPGVNGLSSAAQGERAALLAFQEEVRLLQPLTGQVDRIRRALQIVTPRGSTALVDATYSALRFLEPGSHTPVVVVFSDGVDSLSWLTPTQVVEAAARSDALVYAVAARKRGDPEDPFLDDVTRVTGGRVWTARSERELRARFFDVLNDIRSRYVLTYAPQGVGFSGWHAVDVRLKQRRGDVRARPGYYRAAVAPQEPR